MQKAFFYFLVGLASLDLLFFEVRLSTLALLYVVLHLQADGAAQKYLKDFFKKPCAGAAPHNAPSAEAPQTAKILPFRRESPRPAAAQSSAEEEEIRPPKFGGRPHEVLGVSEDAATRLIVKAFRKWIHQYHPDHAASNARNSATAHARQLNEAKELLLERRKRLRQSRVA